MQRGNRPVGISHHILKNGEKIAEFIIRKVRMHVFYFQYPAAQPFGHLIFILKNETVARKRIIPILAVFVGNFYQPDPKTLVRNDIIRTVNQVFL